MRTAFFVFCSPRIAQNYCSLTLRSVNGANLCNSRGIFSILIDGWLNNHITELPPDNWWLKPARETLLTP